MCGCSEDADTDADVPKTSASPIPPPCVLFLPLPLVAARQHLPPPTVFMQSPSNAHLTTVWGKIIYILVLLVGNQIKDDAEFASNVLFFLFQSVKLKVCGARSTV